MFQRLHLQLTGLCALITIAILAVFTILHLSVSEHSMRENAAFSFQNRFDTLSSSLEQQSVLAYTYLLRMEQSNDCLIFLWDNGIPLSFNDLESHSPFLPFACALYETYCEKAAANALEDNFFFSFSQESWPGENLFTGIGHIGVAGMSTSEKNSAIRQNRGLVLLVISANSALRRQITRQRITFFLLSLAGCFFLTLFSYFFTGRMLKPLRENQLNQLRFIAGASHELRTPLAVILSAVGARTPHFEETVTKETLRMGRLVEELLLLSRLDEQKFSPHFPFSRHSDRQPLFQFTLLEPDTFLLNFYEQMECYVQSEGRSLSLSLPDDELPKIYADEGKLYQFLEILLQNAVSYTKDGGHIHLSLSLAPAPQRRPAKSPFFRSIGPSFQTVCFTVSDDGIGIPDAMKKKVFERFYRIENSHSSKEHFGLGLCIAKEIAEAHNGQIIVTDTPGGGCTFLCFFPANR